MSNYTRLSINKNRGWRGLAKARIYDITSKDEIELIFSFSRCVWEDLIIRHKIVLQDTDNYYVVYFEDEHKQLPSPLQQRSVLIKSFNETIKSITKVKKTEWTSTKGDDWSAIRNFIQNNNNHTTSDWNYIGIRVIPEI